MYNRIILGSLTIIIFLTNIVFAKTKEELDLTSMKNYLFFTPEERIFLDKKKNNIPFVQPSSDKSQATSKLVESKKSK